MGSLLRDHKDLRGALAAYREAQALRQAVYAADPGNEFAYTAVVRAHKSLAEVFKRMGNAAEAAREERAASAVTAEWEARRPPAAPR